MAGAYRILMQCDEDRGRQVDRAVAPGRGSERRSASRRDERDHREPDREWIGPSMRSAGVRESVTCPASQNGGPTPIALRAANPSSQQRSAGPIGRGSVDQSVQDPSPIRVCRRAIGRGTRVADTAQMGPATSTRRRAPMAAAALAAPPLTVLLVEDDARRCRTRRRVLQQPFVPSGPASGGRRCRGPWISDRRGRVRG